MIELKARVEDCDLLDLSSFEHDALAAHAYQQAVEEASNTWFRDLESVIAFINTRAAEILAQWMKGE